MRSPAFALIWEAWQISRRQVIFVFCLMSIGGIALLSAVHDRLDQGGAFLVWMFLLTLTGVTATFIGTVGVRSGFPFHASFSRPISTAVLVGVPFIYTAVLAGAVYVLTVLLLGALFDVSFPLLPVVVVFGTFSSIMTSCSWSTQSAAIRALAIFVVYVLLPALMPFLDRMGSFSAAFPDSVHANSIQIFPFGYMAAALLCILAYAFVVVRVSQLRHAIPFFRRPKHPEDDAPGKRRTASIGAMLRKLAASVPYRCPTKSPIAANVWIHLRGRGLPIILAGLMMSVAIPVLLAAGGDAGMPTAPIYAAVGVAVPFLTAAGTSTWSGEWGWNSKLSAFEGARPQTAFSAVTIDVIVTSFSLLVAYCFIVLALVIPTFGDSAAGQFARDFLAERLSSSSYLALFSRLIVLVGIIVTIVAVVLVLRLLSALFGKALWVTTLAISTYLLLVAASIVGGLLDQVVIPFHFWGGAAMVLAVTIFTCITSTRTGLLTRTQFLMLLLTTACFFALYFGTVVGPDLTLAPRAILVLHATVALLPLTLFTLAPCLFSKLRQTA